METHHKTTLLYKTRKGIKKGILYFSKRNKKIKTFSNNASGLTKLQWRKGKKYKNAKNSQKFFKKKYNLISKLINIINDALSQYNQDMYKLLCANNNEEQLMSEHEEVKANVINKFKQKWSSKYDEYNDLKNFKLENVINDWCSYFHEIFLDQMKELRSFHYKNVNITSTSNTGLLKSCHKSSISITEKDPEIPYQYVVKPVFTESEKIVQNVVEVPIIEPNRRVNEINNMCKESERNQPFECRSLPNNYKLLKHSERKFEVNTGKGRYSSEFKESYCIALGSYGIVCKARDKKHKRIYAIKKIPIYELSEDKAQKEADIMSKLESNFIVGLESFWIEDNYLKADDYENVMNTKDNKTHEVLNKNKTRLLHILMEFCPMTLKVAMKNINEKLNQKSFEVMTTFGYSIASELFIEILEGINYLHKNDVIHRDLKPNNILISDGKNGNFIKIADFGLATIHEFDGQSHTKYKGTDKYVAPEVLRTRKYDTKADIYSLGNVALELFNIDINEPIGKNTKLDNKYSAILNVVERMLSVKISDRPDSEKILDERTSWGLSLNELENINPIEHESGRCSEDPKSYYLNLIILGDEKLGDEVINQIYSKHNITNSIISIDQSHDKGNDQHISIKKLSQKTAQVIVKAQLISEENLLIQKNLNHEKFKPFAEENLLFKISITREENLQKMSQEKENSRHVVEEERLRKTTQENENARLVAEEKCLKKVAQEKTCAKLNSGEKWQLILAQNKENARLTKEKERMQKKPQEKENARLVAEEKCLKKVAQEKTCAKLNSGEKWQLILAQNKENARLTKEKERMQKKPQEKENARHVVEEDPVQKIIQDKENSKFVAEEKCLKNVVQEKTSARLNFGEKWQLTLTQNKENARLAEEKKRMQKKPREKENARFVAQEKIAYARLNSGEKWQLTLTQNKENARLAEEKERMQKKTRENENVRNIVEEERLRKKTQEKENVKHVTEEDPLQKIVQEKDNVKHVTEEDPLQKIVQEKDNARLFAEEKQLRKIARRKEMAILDAEIERLQKKAREKENARHVTKEDPLHKIVQEKENVRHVTEEDPLQKIAQEKENARLFAEEKQLRKIARRKEMAILDAEIERLQKKAQEKENARHAEVERLRKTAQEKENPRLVAEEKCLKKIAQEKVYAKLNSGEKWLLTLAQNKENSRLAEEKERMKKI